LFGIILGFGMGYIIGARKNYITLLFMFIFPIFWKYLAKKIKAFEKKRLNFRKGAPEKKLLDMHWITSLTNSVLSMI
jgi:hypothetical protein